MSKTVSLSSLTSLRKRFRNESVETTSDISELTEDYFKSLDLELIDSPEYPEIGNFLQKEFYELYKKDPSNEFSLAKCLHDNLRLNRNQAANNLYWVYLNIFHFLVYIKNKWLGNEDSIDDLKIDQFFLSLEPSQNSLIRSPIAGLWWAIELTIDNDLVDKYYYSKIFLSERNLRNRTIGTYELIRFPEILKAMLDFHNEYKDSKIEGQRIGSEAFAQQMSKTLNQVGGLALLSSLNKEDIYKLLEENLELIINRAYQVKVGKVVSREKHKKPLVKKEVVDNSVNNHTHFFSLIGSTGEYKVSKNKDRSFDYNVPIDIENEKSFIVHYYKEGKIKKTNLKGLKHKINRGKIGDNHIFRNGINEKLKLNHITSINDDVLFGIAYKSKNDIYVKLLNAQDELHFRSNNDNLRQEGRKVIYTKPFQYSIFKSIPYSYHLELNKLIKTPVARGVKFMNPYYNKEWKILKKIWPELFTF